MRNFLFPFFFLWASILAVPQTGEVEVSESDFETIFGKPQDAIDQLNTPSQPPPTTPDDCKCVPYYLCINGTINTDGEGLINIRSDMCPTSVEICCQLQDVRVAPVTPTLPAAEGCGFRNDNGVGVRIIGDDNEAQVGEFPWAGIIISREIINNETPINLFQCGCSLIHPMAVITAAHCVARRNPGDLKLRFGEWDTETTKEFYIHQDRSVVKIIVHEKYYSGALFNDIAVVILERPVDLTPNVNVLCLPPPGSTFDGAKCVAAGWGKDNFSKRGKTQLIMKKVDLPMVSHGDCQTALRTTRLGHYFNLHQSFVCAGGEAGKDTCTGDGGSPLICPIQGMEDRYYQAGIVAWGIGCGTEGIPGVYVNVPLFTAWIQDVLKANGIQDFYHKP